MSPRSVTVFVKREFGIFKASTLQAEAEDTRSASLAARACASIHFGVPEAWIELLPNGEHLMIAGVVRPSRAQAIRETAVAISPWVVAALVVVALFLFGGGQ